MAQETVIYSMEELQEANFKVLPASKVKLLKGQQKQDYLQMLKDYKIHKAAAEAESEDVEEQTAEEAANAALENQSEEAPEIEVEDVSGDFSGNYNFDFRYGRPAQENMNQAVRVIGKIIEVTEISAEQRGSVGYNTDISEGDGSFWRLTMLLETGEEITSNLSDGYFNNTSGIGELANDGDPADLIKVNNFMKFNYRKAVAGETTWTDSNGQLHFDGGGQGSKISKGSVIHKIDGGVLLYPSTDGKIREDFANRLKRNEALNKFKGGFTAMNEITNSDVAQAAAAAFASKMAEIIGTDL